MKPLLPGPIYEYDVIVYNPNPIVLKVESQVAAVKTPALKSDKRSPLDMALESAYEAELMFGNKKTSEFSPLAEHVQRGANILMFINPIFDDPQIVERRLLLGSEYA